MSHIPDVANSGNLDSLPFWISDHLGEGSSYMTDEVNQSPASPMEGSPALETNPLAAIHPSPSSSPTLGEASLALWRCGGHGNKKSLLGGYPSNVKGWKSKFFFVTGDEWEFSEDATREGAPRVPRTWGVPDKHCNNPPRLYGDEPKVFEEIFKSVEKSGRFSVQVLDPILDRSMNAPSSSSNPTSKSCSDSSLPAELESDAMSKRISFKKLGEKLEKSKNGSSSGTPAPAKGVVIGEKRARESLASSPSKKGKVDNSSKGKGVDRELEGKKKATSLSNAPSTPAPTSSRLGEGTSANLGTVLGPTASILGSPSVAEKLLRGVIPLADKEKVDKLTLDQTATKLFHALVLGSALAVRSREAGQHASLQEGRAASMEIELREALNKAKESAVEEFKSSSEFLVAVEDSTSKYFGEGFEFCKVQLHRHHPDLAIELEGTVLDQDQLAEQDKAAEEKEKLDENEGGREKDAAPL
ncbi:hypothetical protein Acr_17g0011210 [Actinidia rufa]|uniref:Uncharacterized protein n=1 Tax=Actinidia rufa TaxID=165716 RepID=A0A7J0G448_9ERIC|nr:hypothetical protein Acr_17g0011210 [Actinidia rufa]